MIRVTEGAKQEFKKMLTANTDDSEACLRISADEQRGIGIAIDKEKQGDRVIEHEGSKLLLVEKAVAYTLQGITIDVEDTPEGAKLILTDESKSQQDNPQAGQGPGDGAGGD